MACVLATQATAAAMQDSPNRAPRVAQHERAQTLEERLKRKLAAAHKYRVKIRRLGERRQVLSVGTERADVETALRGAQERLHRLERTISALRQAIRERDARRNVKLSPKEAICDVFGRYCDEAVAVAWCESRLSTTARNGQYLGLFQMGSYERRLFGHGQTARQQAVAAHRYFMLSGRDWSPWSCRWAAR